MPLLQVTGGPIAPSGKVLAAGTRLVAIYDKPYVDGVYSYPTNHVAELDLTTGGWKPQGAPDETAFYLPGGADTFPLPPRTTLHEVQVYDDDTQQSFIRGPLHIIETDEGEWFYPTPSGDIKYLDNPSVPAMAVMQSQRNQPMGFAGLDGNGLVQPRLSYEAVANGVATLDENQKVLQRLAYEGVADGVATLDENQKVVQRLAFEAIANGVATLDEDSKLSISQLPIEYGTVDYGEYLRFPSFGLQVCWQNPEAAGDTHEINTAIGSIYRTGVTSFTYPKAFSTIPGVTPLIRRSSGAHYPWGGVYNSTTTACSIIAYGATTGWTKIGYLAIGSYTV